MGQSGSTAGGTQAAPRKGRGSAAPPQQQQPGEAPPAAVPAAPPVAVAAVAAPEPATNGELALAEAASEPPGEDTPGEDTAPHVDSALIANILDPENGPAKGLAYQVRCLQRASHVASKNGFSVGCEHSRSPFAASRALYCL